MARQARDRSELKVYHAILRGVNKQQIFECTEDYEHFVRILQRQCGLPVETRPTRVKTNSQHHYTINSDDETPPYILQEVEATPERHCYLYAWCLMGNHVHLLLKESDEPIGDVMKPFDKLRINSTDTNDNILYIHTSFGEQRILCRKYNQLAA